MKKGIMCDFCGENKAVVTIPNPNATGKNWWNVCDFCNEYINNAQEKHLKELVEHLKKKFDANVLEGEK